MNRFFILAVIWFLWIPAVAAAAKSNHAASLTGTWECIAHGFPQGEVDFSLYLKQLKDNSVTGWVRSPIGTADLTTVDVMNGEVKIFIATPDGNYRLNGRHEQNHITGTWSKDSTLRGKWEGNKSSDSPDPK